MIKKPMLAGTLENLSDLKYPVLCTPKVDGIRCLIVNGKAVTRNFKPIPNNYIRNMLELSDIDNLDGELIIKDVSFNEISSAVMSENGKPNFTYMVFDLYGSEDYQTRMKQLNRHVKLPYIEYLLPIQINNEVEILAYEASCLTNKYEGVMIRAPNSPYKFGRSTVKEGYLLKLKRFYDSEAIVIGLQEKTHNENEAIKNIFGRTERSSHQENQIPANTLGAFIVKELKTGIEFKIGTGMNDELRKQVWLNQKDYIGKIIKYKAQKVGEKNAPRFPSFIGFRNLKDL